MSQGQNLNSSGKSSLLALKWDQKLNFAFCDIQQVFTGRVTFEVHKYPSNDIKVRKRVNTSYCGKRPSQHFFDSSIFQAIC